MAVQTLQNETFCTQAGGTMIDRMQASETVLAWQTTEKAAAMNQAEVKSSGHNHPLGKSDKRKRQMLNVKCNFSDGQTVIIY